MLNAARLKITSSDGPPYGTYRPPQFNLTELLGNADKAATERRGP